MERDLDHWEYRAFQTRYRYSVNPQSLDDGVKYEDDFSIRTVFFDSENNPVAVGGKPIVPVGDTLTGLQDMLRLMLSDSTWPVITPRDVPGYEYDPGEVVIPNKELDA